MSGYLLLVILVSLSAAFSYINHRFIKMPFVIGLFFLTTVLSLIVLTAKWWDFRHFIEIKDTIEHIDISGLILNVMLGFLLFAGALHTKWRNIRPELKSVSVFAIGGVISSTVLIAAMLYWLCNALDINIDLIHCLVFGALISPTDPIAVLGILTRANVPKKIESTIVGESLFNDGVGVVIFITLMETMKAGGGDIDYGHFGYLFLEEAVGGTIFGLALGYILHKLLKSIDNYGTEVLLTIAFVMAGYTASLYMHISGPLAMVAMGLVVGNFNTQKAMSDLTQEYVHKFWELVDVILNAILFISIAFVMVVIDFESSYILVGLATILIVLFSRIIIVYTSRTFFPRLVKLNRNEAKIVVWGGLRGGLSIALVLSLPNSQYRSVLLIATYCCVVFSILVQGLTIGRVAKRLLSKEETRQVPD